MNVITDNSETLKNALARIAELEEENKRLNVGLSNVIEVFQSSSSGDDLEMAECAREIMEILDISCYRHGKVKSRFSEAKEIICEYVRLANLEKEDTVAIWQLYHKAEQFLKDSEMEERNDKKAD